MRNIIVLGMHRSGTSMVAGALAASGIYVGRDEELLADQADNPLGFWERRDVVDFDEHILLQSGGSWFNPPQSVSATSSTDADIQGILARLPTNKSWLLKDPRMVLTWPLLQSALADPVVVFVYRSPLAVATSLQRRNGFPLSLGLALWEIYNQRALDALSGCDSFSVAFESVLATPDTALAALLTKLATLGVSCETQPRLAAVDASLGKSGAASLDADKSLLSATQVGLAAYCEALCNGERLPLRPALDNEVWLRTRDLATALAPLARVQETQIELEDMTLLCAERTAERDESLKVHRGLEQEHHALAQAHSDEVAQHRLAVTRISGLEQKIEALFVELSSAYGKLLAFEDSLLARVWHFVGWCYKLVSLRRGVRSGYDDVLADAQAHFIKHDLSLQEEQDTSADKPVGKIALLSSVIRYLVRNPAGSVRSFSLPRLRRAAAVFMTSTPEDLGVWIDSRFPGENFGGALMADFDLDATLDDLQLVFPVAERPQVSVIVPVYNEYRMTVRCLRSVLENTVDVDYEIIVADDCSSDATGSIAQRLHNITHIRGEKNQGFLRNCNAAATSAIGKYIVFLNNDTVVCPGWLQPLLKVTEEDESVGVVGPKLLFANGKLQEAGAIMWRDASAWNFGRMDQAEKPEYNYLKESDYISGACLMIRAELWQQLGGFDTRYTPAYYEDADIAFAAREAGYKVIYQPLSLVVHFEGMSNGTDLSAGVKKYQVQNQQKFRQKWAEQLDAFHFQNAQHVCLARDRSRGRRSVLFIDHYVPHFDKDAGSRSTFMYVQQMLELGYRVMFLGANYFAHKPYTEILQQMGVEVLVGEHMARTQDRWLKDNAPYIDRIYLHRPHVAEQFLGSLEKMSPRPPVIFFGHDLHYLRLNREYRLMGDEQLRRDAEKWRKREFSVFDKVDKIYYPSQVEVDEVLDLRPDLDVRAIPLYVVADNPVPEYDFATTSDILFVGGFNHPPNVDAVCWFVEEVLPLVREICPGIRLHLVGSNPTAAVEALQSEQVLVYGYLPDAELAGLYRRVRQAVVPLRFGAGVKGKVLEAIQQNVPLVTTSIGAEGIPEAELVMNIAETAGDFAARIIAVEVGEPLVLGKLAHYPSWLQRNFSSAKAQQILREDFGEPLREFPG